MIFLTFAMDRMFALCRTASQCICIDDSASLMFEYLAKNKTHQLWTNCHVGSNFY